MGDNYILAGEGALFVQTKGPNTKPEYLGCHVLGDLAEPFGDLTLIWRRDPSGPNKFIRDGFFQGEPGLVTTSVEVTSRKTRDWLEKLGKCSFSFYVMHANCGRADNINNWDRMFVLEESMLTNRSDTNLAINSPDAQEKSIMALDMSAVRILRAWELAVSRVTTTETEDLNDIFSCNTEQCSGDCGDAIEKGDTLYAVGDLLAGSALNMADMLTITEQGSSVVIDPGKPFASGEVIASVRCFEISSGVTRIIVARGTTDPSNPAEIAYRDSGVAWTNVDIGSVDGQYALGPRSLFVLDQYNVWLVTDGGYIYKSEDGGITWTAKSSALTAQDLYAIHFVSEKIGFAVGENNAILKTVDGGDTWSLVTGPVAQAAVTINTVHVLSKNRIWLGYNDGKLYYSHDGGDTWTRRTGFSRDGTGSIAAMDWYDDHFGVVLNNVNSIGYILVTVDGGYDWKELSNSNTIASLKSVIVISPTLIWVVGDASGGTGVILKISAE